MIRMYKDSDTFDSKSALRAQSILDALKPYVDSAGKTAAPTRLEIIRKALVVQPPAPPRV
jgi:hypothetical protein